jgi:hypothetical protein
MDHDQSQSQQDIGGQTPGQVTAQAGPTRWQQDARVATHAALLLLGGGLLVLDGALVGGWMTGAAIGGWVGAVLVALGCAWLGVRRWRRRGALLPRDISGPGLFGMAVLVGLLWLLTNGLNG